MPKVQLIKFILKVQTSIHQHKMMIMKIDLCKKKGFPAPSGIAKQIQQFSAFAARAEPGN